MIAGDYCLRDTTRSNDCFAFTIFPYKEDFGDLCRRIRAVLPRDIKKSRFLTAKGAELLQSPDFFHFVIMVPKEREIFTNGPGTNPLEISREVAKKTLASAQGLGRGPDTIAPLKGIVEHARAKKFKFELYGDLLLLGLFFPYLSLLIAREGHVDLIGWFSDRDDMTIWADGVVWTHATESVRGLGERFGINLANTAFPIGVPNPETGEMWFDDLIRLPDYFAGTMAAWNRKENKLPEQRKSLVFCQMLEHVIAGGHNVVILGMDITEKGVQWKRIAIDRRGNALIPLGPPKTEQCS